jgi:hypothetical protein
MDVVWCVLAALGGIAALVGLFLLLMWADKFDDGIGM